MPSTPFMGVRISWLILDRNSALALTSAVLAASSRLMLNWAWVMLRLRSLRAKLISKPLMHTTHISASTSSCGAMRVRPSSAGRITRVPILKITIAMANMRAGL
ncbi:hypothetical protein PS685_04862 [Pseudomonas fluorescens]|uniref:Uncharacterized protein n=1 Tax=Pseudomonas fluorescens TaxID=294 RepID=A0A5E6ZW28_PSEFL|nr:hypothetical protein PS685_04862 [Pseudomonas fluorescens]